VTKEVYVTTVMRVEVECESLTLTLTLTLIFFHFVYLEFGKGGGLICIDVVVIWVVSDVDCLAIKLQVRFLIHDVMDNLGVVYPQYWL
jgi:hypothetical protein